MESDGVVYTLEAYLSDLSVISYPTNIKGKQNTMKQSKTKRDNKFKSSENNNNNNNNNKTERRLNFQLRFDIC